MRRAECAQQGAPIGWVVRYVVLSRAKETRTLNFKAKCFGKLCYVCYQIWASFLIYRPLQCIETAVVSANLGLTILLLYWIMGNLSSKWVSLNLIENPIMFLGFGAAGLSKAPFTMCCRPMAKWQLFFAGY